MESSSAPRGGGALKIGDLARLTGKTVRTLHFYEEQEILHPVSRTDGGFRLYNMDSLLRVGLIEKLQVLGMTVPDIRELLHRFEHAETGTAAARTFRNELMEKRRALDEEIQRLTALKSEISETIEYLAYCVHSCHKATAPQMCPSCGYASDEEHRPELMAGVYT